MKQVQNTLTRADVFSALQAAVKKERANCSRFAELNDGNAAAIRERVRDSMIFASAINAVIDELTAIPADTIHGDADDAPGVDYHAIAAAINSGRIPSADVAAAVSQVARIGADDPAADA